MFDSSFCYGVSSFRRFVVPLWRFVMSYRRFDMSFRRFDMSFRRFGTPILLGPFSELPVRFVGSSRLSFRRFVMPFRRFVVAFVVSLCRFVVSSCRFVVSTRPLREAIIRRTLHEGLSISAVLRALRVRLVQDGGVAWHFGKRNK